MHRIIVTKRGRHIDFRVRVLIEGVRGSQVIFDDRLDRIPGECVIHWTSDSKRVRVFVDDLAGAIDVGYDVAERKLLIQEEKVMIDGIDRNLRR